MAIGSNNNRIEFQNMQETVQVGHNHKDHSLELVDVEASITLRHFFLSSVRPSWTTSDSVQPHQTVTSSHNFLAGHPRGRSSLTISSTIMPLLVFHPADVPELL